MLILHGPTHLRMLHRLLHVRAHWHALHRRPLHVWVLHGRTTHCRSPHIFSVLQRCLHVLLHVRAHCHVLHRWPLHVLVLHVQTTHWRSPHIFHLLRWSSYNLLRCILQSHALHHVLHLHLLRLGLGKRTLRSAVTRHTHFPPCCPDLDHCSLETLLLTVYSVEC